MTMSMSLLRKPVQQVWCCTTTRTEGGAGEGKVKEATQIEEHTIRWYDRIEHYYYSTVVFLFYLRYLLQLLPQSTQLTSSLQTLFPDHDHLPHLLRIRLCLFFIMFHGWMILAFSLALLCRLDAMSPWPWKSPPVSSKMVTSFSSSFSPAHFSPSPVVLWCSIGGFVGGGLSPSSHNVTSGH